jgi:hypothetical protein
MNNNYSYNNYEPYHLKGTNHGDNLAYKDHKERVINIRDYTGHKSHKEDTYGTHSYNIMENYQLNRNKDVYIKNDNPVLLDDREMFNKFSNNNDTEIDFNANNDKSNFRSVHIYNNKKNLINNPYIVKNSTNSANMANMAYNDNTTYGSNFDNTTYGSNYDNTTYGSNYDTTFINDGTTKDKGKSKTNNNSFDKEYQRDFIDKSKNNTSNVIEKDIIDDFIYNLSSCDSSISPKVPLAPYLLSYLIYSIILLSKNPTTDKLLQTYKIKSKDIAINEMKDISDDVSKYGDITYMVPSGCNNAFINKIKDIFNITVTTYDTDSANGTEGEGDGVTVYANFNYKLGIPMCYNPEIIYDYFDNDKKNKAKFIKLRNCIISHDYYKDDTKGGGGGGGTVCIEILLEQTKLGFIFNSNKQSLNNALPYHMMIKEKDFSITSKKVIIPQISNNIKDCNYNINNLENIHLGELLNGSLITPQLYLNTSLEIDILPTPTTNPTSPQTITKKVEAITINCDSYYYIKNENNKLIYIGLVHHNPQ